jgi:hypothetical protein
VGAAQAVATAVEVTPSVWIGVMGNTGVVGVLSAGGAAKAPPGLIATGLGAWHAIRARRIGKRKIGAGGRGFFTA